MSSLHRDEGSAPPILLVALHGYGSSGNEMRRWLADAERELGSLAGCNVTVWAPTSGDRAPLARQGWCWFPLTSRMEELRERAHAPAMRLAEELKARQRALGIGAAQTGLIGFSQGCSVAVQMLGRHQVAARAAFLSGRCERPPGLAVSRRLALLGVVGDRDRFVDPQRLHADLEAFGAGSHELRVLAGVGHELSREAALLALPFCLGESASGLRPVRVAAGDRDARESRREAVKQ